MLQGQQNIRGVELGSVLLKAPDLTQVEEKLATGAVLEAEVELALSLERVVHFDDKFVIHAFQNTALIKRMLQLITA